MTNNSLVDRCRSKIKWLSTRFWLSMANFALNRAYKKWAFGCGVSDRIRFAIAETKDAKRIVP